MSWLERDQAAMEQALDHGPGHLPAGLFAGSPSRILAGMKVHANTISHARLVALEDTFPRTRDLIGHVRFNAHSRLYLEQPGVTALAQADIGQHFVQFLDDHGESADITDLARFEWWWLAAYHAADAHALSLADLAGVEPAAVMEIKVQRHPATHVLLLDRPVHDLIGHEVPGLAEADAILVCRPLAEVLVAPSTRLMATLLQFAEKPTSIGNLLARTCEQDHANPAQDDLEEAMQALIALLEVGALCGLANEFRGPGE